VIFKIEGKDPVLIGTLKKIKHFTFRNKQELPKKAKAFLCSYHKNMEKKKDPLYCMKMKGDKGNKEDELRNIKINEIVGERDKKERERNNK
jgi:hypothetical protein